jgi:hypothetical protein
MPLAPTVRNQVFVSYSHADEDYLKRLRVHLSLLERRNIKIWTDKDIAPGMNWQDEIANALARTKVAVLMISTDFLNSDFITRQELPPLLAAAKSEGVEILPVIVKPSAFGDIDVEPLSCYQAVNMGRPLVKLKDDSEREEEFVRILQVIRKHMEGAPRPAPAGAARVAAAEAAPARAASPRQADVAAADESPVEEDQLDTVPEEAAPLTFDDLHAELEEMLADPTAQALSVIAATPETAFELMVVTEGEDGTVVLEVLGNDELPAELQLGREAQQLLTREIGLNRPKQRGDRFWTIFGSDGAEIDTSLITEVMAAVLTDVFQLPNADIAVAWRVLEQ